MPPTISPEILQAALAGLRLQEQKIQEQIAEVESMLGGRAAAPTTPSDAPQGSRKKRSLAVRRKMALAQKKRWQAIKGTTTEEPVPNAPEAPKAKRKISAEGMKNIIAATKRRWKRQKAEARAAATKKTKTVAAKGTPAKAAKRVAPVKRVAAKRSVPKKTALDTAPAVAATSAQ